MSDFKRQHPAAAVDQLFTVIRKNLITFIILFFLGTRESESSFFQYLLLFSLALSLVSGVLSWWLFRYRVINNELQIRKGIIIRKNLYLTKDRIQVIDISEGIVQRIFGLVKLEVKTAGSGTETATLNAISREEAERLRVELRDAAGSAEPAGRIGEDIITAGKEKFDVQYITAKDLLVAAATSGSFGLIASLLGAAAGQLDMFVTDENIDYLTEHLPETSNVVLVTTVVFTILAVSWLLSFLGVILKYYNFSVRRTDKELIVTSGLIERKQITIPYNRIQAVRFVEGVFRQPFRSGMLYVESAGFEVKERESSITLFPYLSTYELTEFFERFLPGFEIDELTIKPPGKSRWRYLRRPNYWLIILLPAFWWFVGFNWGALLIIPVLTYLGWLQMRDSGLGLTDEYLTICHRGLARTTAVIQRKRIMSADLHMNPFQTHKQVADFTVTAASGAKGINFQVRDLSREDVLKTLKWVTDAHYQR